MTALSHLRFANLALMSLAVATLTACGGSSEADTSEAAAPVGAASPTPAPGVAPTPPAPTPPAPGPAPTPPPPLPPAAVGSATLQWSASSDSRVVGYRVYWGTTSRAYQAKGNGAPANGGNISHLVGGLQSKRTYYFAVTAYDNNGSESDFSAEATKTIP